MTTNDPYLGDGAETGAEISAAGSSRSPIASVGSFLRRITRVKPESMIMDEIAEEQTAGDGLKKNLSAFAVTLFGAANVIGVGIFMTTSKAAIGDQAGSSVILAFALAALTCAISGVCYARFAGRISSSGSSYTYIYSSMGEIYAFFAGLGLSCETSIACAALARAWSESMQKNSGITLVYKAIPDYIEIDFIAPVITIIITLICLSGAKESARFGTVMTCINVSLILIFIGIGLSAPKFNVSNISGSFMPGGLASLMRATSTCFFCYCGWDSVCCLSEEVQNPKKVIPKAIAGCLSIVGVLYCAVAFALCGMMSFNEMNDWIRVHGENPSLFDAFRHSGVSWAYDVFKWAILLTSFTASLASAQGQPRVWYRMSRDGLMPVSLRKTTDGGTLRHGIIWSGLLSTLLGTLLNLDTITNAIAVGVLLMQTFVCVGCLVYEVDTRCDAATSFFMKILMTILLVSSVFLGGAIQEKGFDWTIVSYATACFIVFLVISMIALMRKAWVHALAPVFAIFLNSFYMGSNGFSTVGALAGAYAILSLGYFFYGLRFSRLAVIARNVQGKRVI